MRITPRKRIGLVLAELLDDLFLQALQTSTTRRIWNWLTQARYVAAA